MKKTQFIYYTREALAHAAPRIADFAEREGLRGHARSALIPHGRRKESDPMSRWISQEAARLAPYTPGEQPQDQQYVKLNTNESPFPPSPKVLKAINRAEILKLNLYSDPACAASHRGHRQAL